MAASDRDGIDFRKLEASLAAAVEADARYDRENDAKLRAMAQKVQTYEEFEGLVKGAHIKPVEEDITNLDLKRSSWSSSGRARDRERRAVVARTAQEPSPAVTPTQPPANVQQFLRDWRKHCKDASSRSSYLLMIGGERLGKLFAAEVGHGLLGEFVVALDKSGAAEEQGEAVAAILAALAETNRFALTVEFFSSQEAKHVESLLGKLERCGGDVAGRVATLRSLYTPA